ncbi:MAG: anhydro-N-acetylmuramic acid kinase [Bacteroidales bacterium]|nr:anhydro-N-acetylmuramic acid kinase [Bacteroidales bacterium]
MKRKYYAIGLMSGTSLDGLDIVACSFIKQDDGYSFQIEAADFIAYSSHWQDRLNTAHKLKPDAINTLDIAFGKYCGKVVRGFLIDRQISPSQIDLIASHGHTVFHDPEQGITRQIGAGKEIADETGIPVVYDFRVEDVEMGGQGAPLVPIGDHLLFSEYNQCLNLGGFSNISYQKGGKRIAYDISPVNFVLNYLADLIDYQYDRDGEIARSGKLLPELYEALEALDYYRQKPPKSLGREWVEKSIFPLLQENDYAVPDLLHTFMIHITKQIASPLSGKVLVTGGGAKNKYLIELLNQKSNAELIIPDEQIVDYKEALVFALLGVLRFENRINVLASVTGASNDHSAGTISKP